jgi:hypothetical protein
VTAALSPHEVLKYRVVGAAQVLAFDARTEVQCAGASANGNTGSADVVLYANGQPVLVVEVKTIGDAEDMDRHARSLAQTRRYMTSLGCDAGWLLVPWEEPRVRGNVTVGPIDALFTHLRDRAIKTWVAS